ncbi:hypothetical protein [Pacificoceanicola onchidii]|uniref:hypothetical protein n=1 Tax=Pacificoceanicola onchidii TaxID=2562685 RepID=UPI0010A5C723|nr:hypothetical protein [Pacificoceanicola onchidii]
MIRTAFVFMSLLIAAPLQAEEDPMAMQRCVWACLANFGPADNPAYAQCVAEHCSDIGAEAPEIAWENGALKNGTRYAGVNTPDGSRGLYYFCNKTGRSDLMIAGVPEVAGSWSLAFGEGEETSNTHMGWHFTPVRNGVAVSVPSDHAVFTQLRSRAEVAIADEGGATRFTLPLRGSTAALLRTLAGCS